MVEKVRSNGRASMYKWWKEMLAADKCIRNGYFTLPLSLSQTE